jgi:hypothetical protein
MGSTKCKYCNKSWKELELEFKSTGSKANHSRWCLLNPESKKYRKNLEKHNNVKLMQEAKILKYGQEGWRKGLTKETDERVKKGGETLKKRYDSGELIGVFKNKHHTEETKNKMSKSKLELIKKGLFLKAGRCKKIKFNSIISGEFYIDGSWELKFCEWCDKNNIKIQRSGLRFEYIKPNGKTSLYHPDFKIEDYYIEIKGYETELDRCKWGQFPEKLIILRKEQIFNLNNFCCLNDLKGFMM